MLWQQDGPYPKTESETYRTELLGSCRVVRSFLIGEKQYVEIGGRRKLLTYSLAEPIAFHKSHEFPGLQLADVIASAISYAMRTRDDVEGNSWLQQIETIRGQLRDAIRNAKVIEMMADDAKEPPTDKWFGSSSRWVN
jgi:Protein of unknown function (DUF3800)